MPDCRLKSRQWSFRRPGCSASQAFSPVSERQISPLPAVVPTGPSPQQFRVLEKPKQVTGQFGAVMLWDKEPRLAVLYDFRDIPVIGGHDREACRLRLDQRNRRPSLVVTALGSHTGGQQNAVFPIRLA